MATVNRYSTFTPAQYTPYSLQELMLAPSYMRQQHDALSETGATLQGQIAQVDPLSVHSQRAAEEQQRLNDMINSQVDLLNREGFTPASKTNFIRLNKEYQQSVSPTGLLGKINAAKAAYDQAKQTSIGQLVQQGYDPDRAAYMWDQHYGKYAKDFESTGTIKNIENLYGPNVIDYRKEFAEYAKNAGINTDEVIKGGYVVRDDQTGQFVVNWDKQDINSTNKQGLQFLANMMNERILSQDGDIGRYLDFAGIDRQTAINDIFNLKGAFTDTKTSRGYSESRGTQLTKAEDVSNPFDGAGITATARMYIPEGNLDYNELTNTIKSLQSLSSRTPDQEIKLGQLTQHRNELISQLKAIGTGEGFRLTQDADYLQKEISTVSSLEFGGGNPKFDEFYQQEIASIDKNQPGLSQVERQKLAIEGAQVRYKGQLNSQLEKVNKDLEPYMEQAAKDVRVMTDSYAVTPRTTKQNSIHKVMNDNLARLVGSSPQVLEQNANIISVIDSNGNTIQDLSPNDKTNISKLAYNSALSKDNAVQLVEFTPKDANGLPSYTLRIKTNGSYNVDGWRKGKVGGEDGSMTVTLNFNEASIGAVKNINGYIGEYLALSGNEGLEVATAMNYQLTENAVKTRFIGQTWGEAISEIPVMDNGKLTAVGEIYAAELASLSRELFQKPLISLNPQERSEVEQKLLESTIR